VTRPPKLSFHKHRKTYFIKWGGHFHWLGKDRALAERLYLEDATKGLPAWTKWKISRERATPRPHAVPIVAELLLRFFDAKATEGGPGTLRFYKGSLARFGRRYGRWPADSVTPFVLQTFKDNLLRLGLARKTVNHEIAAVKTAYLWGSDLLLIPPANFRGVRSLPLPPPEPKGYTLTEVREMLKRVDADLAAWIALAWLTAARPSEVVRVVNGEGQWAEAGVYRLPGKTTLRSGHFRHLAFSERALLVLQSCRPRWRRPGSWSWAMRRVLGPGGPHPLRHGAATHLIRAGVTRAQVDLILGHLPPRVSLTYAPIEWQLLRQSVARLQL